jgi:hypothetical protein
MPFLHPVAFSKRRNVVMTAGLKITFVYHGQPRMSHSLLHVLEAALNRLSGRCATLKIST